MEQHQEQFEKVEAQRHQHTLARRLAPEDFAPGMYVTILHAVVERWPSAFCEAYEWKSPPVYHQLVPPFAGMPFRVVGVCLPFVLLQRADGVHWTGDLRRYRFARLSDRFGAEAFKHYAADAARTSKTCCEDDDDEDD